MSAGNDCCTPCPTVTTTNIPGTPGATGAAGADGEDGVNAFTFVDAPGFVVPAPGANVTVPTLDCSWMAVGQKVFITGAGTFEVVSRDGAGASCSLEYLEDYVGNTEEGSAIAEGAQVSPAGTQPTFLPSQSFYAVAGSQALTASNAQLLSAVVTLPTAGQYIISASVRLDFDSATTTINRTCFLKLRETTNGPADVANAVREVKTGLVTTATGTLTVATLPTVVYTAEAGDTIQLQGSISAVPYSGDVDVIEATILAHPIA